MSVTNVTSDVIVVGAGAIGAALALQVARQRPDLTISVIERQSMVRDSKARNMRVWALGSAATHLLEELGVFSQLTANSCHSYSKMVVWDENSDGELIFDAAEYSSKMLGQMVDADSLTRLLQKEMQGQANIEVFYQRILDDADFTQAHPELISETHCFVASLVVAADGANSWVRQQAKIFAPSNSYEQLGLAAKIKTELLHQDTAWQRFLKTGPIAVLPLSENQSSIVWSCSNDLSKELLSLDKMTFEQRLQTSLDNRLGAVELLSEIASFPLKSRQAETYTKPGLALVGDAAHSIHPLAGQGANLGFKDVIELSRLLCNSDTVDDPALLKKYQRSRRADNLQTDFFMTALHRAYGLNLPIWRLVRGIGMNWITKNQPLKKQLANQAMGLENS